MRTMIPEFSVRRGADWQRVSVLCCGIACALFASLTHAQAAQDFSKVEIKPKKLADDFYVIDESEAAGGSISVLTGRDGVLMVDTGVKPLAPKVQAAINKLSSQPIRYVINTHVHGDETDGNEHFGRLGATVIARESVRYNLLHPRPLADGLPRKPAPAAAVPALTYAGNMSLHFNDQEIRLIAAPPAHTDGDTLIHFPDLDIIVAGDVLRANEYPSINRPSGGTLPGMLDALARLIGLAGPETRIVTSHGEVVGRSVVIAQRDFLLASRDRVTALIAQGKSVDEVIAANITADLNVQAATAHISSEHFVRDVYAEVKAAQ